MAIIGWLSSPQVSSLVVNMLEQGCLFAFLGLGVLISFRFFRFPRSDGRGKLSARRGGRGGAARRRVDPFVATGVATLAGAAAGAITGLVHTKLRINNIIAGIIVMTAIYSVNLRVMGGSNTPLLATGSVFDDAVAALAALGLPLRAGPLATILVLVVALVAVACALGLFFRTTSGSRSGRPARTRR